ncbi:MAG: hypothetical protein IJ762_06610 [Bacteroidaceae bacterium]|nr:hypothetical protein [Bacteroidaceae bacterium]
MDKHRQKKIGWGTMVAQLSYFLIFSFSHSLMAQPADTVRADFFRDYYHQGHLVHWLDALSDHTVYQGLHVGQWDESGQLMFSVDGNSYRWNRFYVDGMRLDNRFTPGSTSFVPNMEQYHLRLDPNGSVLSFEQDTIAKDYAQVSWNRGNLGGISPTTEGIIHLFHNTGKEDAYNPQTIHRRQYVRGQGTMDLAYTLKTRDGRPLRQHLYASIGEQCYPNYDHEGLLTTSPIYSSGYYKVQMDGQLPAGRWLDRLGYWVNFSGKENYGAEFYLNPAEVMRLNTYSATLYAKRRGLTTGLTWATNRVRHDDLQFSRNLADPDGESLEPWMADGQTHELSWSLSYERPLQSWLTLKADGYNSMLLFRPSATHFSNEVYLQHMKAATATPLYRYDWTSRRFASGLLENKVGVEAGRHFGSRGQLSLSGIVNLTLDGMLLGGRSKVTPNVQALFSLQYRPVRWLEVGLTLGHDRVSYNIEDLRYMSRDYMNAEVRFSQSDQLFTTVGGARHHYAHRLWQPAYMTLNVPIHLRFGRHEIALLQTYKKFYHTWMTRFRDGVEANGALDADGFYFLLPGERDYVVDYLPTSLMGGGFFTNTPYYMSQTSRYTYRGRKFWFSLSWQSMIGAGVSALGNGPVSNNIGVLSESTANPNTLRPLENASGRHPAVGRLDQDRAYVCRIYLAYNPNEHFQFGITGRWTDGQPFAYFNTAEQTDGAGNMQVAIRPGCTRGINPTDGNFGCRESALFNIDLHARFQWTMGDHHTSLSLLCYNLYDFGNVYNEMCFPQGLRGLQRRGPNMTLTIPRGLIGTLKIEL